VKDFSIFEYALRFSGVDQTENLGQTTNISRRDFAERESFLCRTTTPSVEYCCLMIENALLLRTNRSGRVYAGFERLSCLQPVIDRYLRIADVSESVYIFGEPDWQPPRHPNIKLITLSSDFRLAREWFLIAQSSSLNAAFLAFDEIGYETDLPEQIRYWALKTSDAAIVRRLSNALEGMIDWTLAA
jgi:DICT domain-containing protein